MTYAPINPNLQASLPIHPDQLADIPRVPHPADRILGGEVAGGGTRGEFQDLGVGVAVVDAVEAPGGEGVPRAHGTLDIARREPQGGDLREGAVRRQAEARLGTVDDDTLAYAVVKLFYSYRLEQTARTIS